MPIETRREQVLDAALRLIITHGYAGTSMEAIAREAGLSKPVVYNAYPRLGELLRALLDRERTRAFGALRQALPAEGDDTDPAARLLHWLRILVGAVEANPDAWRLILLQPDGTPEVVRDNLQAGRRFALDQLRTVLRGTAPRDGALKDLDVDLAAEAVLAVAEQSARLLLLDPETYPPERLLAFADQIVHAYLQPD